MITVNDEGTLEMILSGDLLPVRDVAPYIVERFAANPQIVSWLLEAVSDDDVVPLLVEAAIHDPDCELVLRGLVFNNMWDSNELAQEILKLVAARHHDYLEKGSHPAEPHWIHAVHTASTLQDDARAAFWATNHTHLDLLTSLMLSAIRANDRFALLGLASVAHSVLTPVLIGSGIQSLRTALSRAEEILHKRAKNSKT
jgi:hypothetical protein